MLNFFAILTQNYSVVQFSLALLNDNWICIKSWKQFLWKICRQSIHFAIIMLKIYSQSSLFITKYILIQNYPGVSIVSYKLFLTLFRLFSKSNTILNKTLLLFNKNGKSVPRRSRNLVEIIFDIKETWILGLWYWY